MASYFEQLCAAKGVLLKVEVIEPRKWLETPETMYEHFKTLNPELEEFTNGLGLILIQ